MCADVAFFGYGTLAVAGLDALSVAGAHVSAVVVPSNRSGTDVDIVRNAAARHNARVFVQPARGEVGPFVDTLHTLAPAFIVVCSYTMILPQAVLSSPTRGAVNLHGGTLPEYRGGHVMQWAIINGEREFGVALHHLDEGIDTGPIIAEARFPLDDTDDACSVRRKIQIAGTDLLTQWWPRLVDGTAPRVAQDSRRARLWPKRTVEDGRLTWTMSAATIVRTVRALRCNSPGAFLDVTSRRLSIRLAQACAPQAARVPPGRVVAVDRESVRVAAVDGDVQIRSAEIDGAPATPETVAQLLAAA
jgi:methionyl-tRNA formyltransferase